MNSYFREFRCKEIIDIDDGLKIGYVDDLVFDTDTADVVSLVVHGHSRLFGLLGRDDDLIISWNDIQTIGTDAILVKINDHDIPKRPPKTNYFEKLFG